MSTNGLYLAIDIGGTYIKGAMLHNRGHVAKVQSPFFEEATIEHFIHAIDELTRKLNPENLHLAGIGISCTGVVNYHGTAVEKTTQKHSLLKNTDWRPRLESHYSCPVVIINDNDAATIGMSELGYLRGTSTVGVMTIGTGLGFSVWRNGRRWRPGGKLPLLGSIHTQAGSYNEIASASKLALSGKGSLTDVLLNPELQEVRDYYFRNLAGIATTATILYHLDEVCLAGGLVDAASSIGFDIGKQLLHSLEQIPAELDKPVVVKIVREGNLLQLLGAGALIKGECTARQQKGIPAYDEIKTEIPYNKDLLLHQFGAEKLVGLLLNAENKAGIQLLDSTLQLAQTAEKIAASLRDGGRLIYVGAGTSGRIAAMDAVEIPCTFGLAKDRVIALVAGGVADAAIDIESNFEEDASSVPEMLLLGIGEKDVVIGISASGSAWFVQSALAFARTRGAFTVMIQAVMPREPLPFCDRMIPLHSGYEVVAGSTRMKAGTATKKVLNCLTTTAMILNGEVVGPYMTGLACINNKLIARAQAILQEVYRLSGQDSLRLLRENDMDLKKVMGILERGDQKQTIC